MPLTLAQALAQLDIGGSQLLGVDCGRVVFRDRVDELLEGLFQALEVAIDTLVHGISLTMREEICGQGRVTIVILDKDVVEGKLWWGGSGCM